MVVQLTVLGIAFGQVLTHRSVSQHKCTIGKLNMNVITHPT